MRNGENAMAVIQRVKAKLADLADSLPPGVTVKAFYDRSELIDRTIDTLRHALTGADPTDRIVVFGSFLTVGGVLQDGLPRLGSAHGA